MKSINIFVAGAKRLDKERTRIKAMAMDLCNKYQSRGISIIAKSFEDFKDDQNEYNIFIKEKADIVIFLIDGYLGDKTKDEFITATDSYSRKKRPDIIVFMRKYEHNTQQMEEARETINERLGDKYYVEYSDLNDLKLKAEDRLDRAALEKSYTLGKRKLIRTGVISLFLILIIISISFWSLYKHQLNNDKFAQIYDSIPPPLLFIGGGSVRNYIEKEMGGPEKFSIDNYKKHPNSISIPLSSNNSWRILTEEIHQRIRKQKPAFFTVCLSAQRIDSTYLNSHFNMVLQNEVKANIVGIHIGYDTLTVYISEDLYQDCKNKKLKGLADLKGSEITCIELDTLLKQLQPKQEKEKCIYTTTERSGTLKKYQDAMKVVDTNVIKEYEVFYDCMDVTAFKNKPYYILLGSTYYNVPHLTKRKLVVTSNGQAITKDLYIYFLAYKKKGFDPDKGYKYITEQPIKDFLLELKLEPDSSNRDLWQSFIANGENGYLLDSDFKKYGLFEFKATVNTSSIKQN